MTALNLVLDRQLARTVAYTGYLKRQPRRFTALTRVVEAVDFIARAVFHLWRNHRYLSFLKLANLALVELQFRFKTERVVGRPYKMKIESTNICNTHCQLCPTGLGIEGRPKGKMSMEQFKGLVDRTHRHLLALDLSMWGDPLIVPEIFDMIRYAHDKGVWTYISSNLHAFKPAKGQAELLVNSGLDLLTCSLHGASQATYELYQPGKKFDDSVAKIRHILETRDRMKSRSPQVQLNFVVTRYNEHEKDAFKALAASLGCKPVFSWAALNTRFAGKDSKLQPLGLAPDLLSKKTRQHIEKWLPQDVDHRLDIYRQMLTDDIDFTRFNGRKIFDCSWPWRQSVINWDGQVVTCCGSFEVSEDIGNVFEQPFGKIWNSEKYRMARRSFKRKLTDAQAKDNGCANCPGIML